MIVMSMEASTVEEVGQGVQDTLMASMVKVRWPKVFKFRCVSCSRCGFHHNGSVLEPSGSAILGLAQPMEVRLMEGTPRHRWPDSRV